MSRFTSDDQLKFLMSCIRWSNNGKVNFEEVSKQCNIVTKNAAAKRYKRLKDQLDSDTANDAAMDSVEGDADQAKSGGTPKSKSITKTAARTAAAKGKGKGKDKESNGKDSYSSSSDGGGIKKSAAATKLPKSALAAAASAAGGGKSHAKRRASLEERIQMPELLSSPTPAGKPTDGATIVKEEPADDSSEYCPEETDPLLPKKIKEEDDAGDEHSDSQEDSEFDALCERII